MFQPRYIPLVGATLSKKQRPYWLLAGHGLTRWIKMSSSLMMPCSCCLPLGYLFKESLTTWRCSILFPSTIVACTLHTGDNEAFSAFSARRLERRGAWKGATDSDIGKGIKAARICFQTAGHPLQIHHHSSLPTPTTQTKLCSKIYPAIPHHAQHNHFPLPGNGQLHSRSCAIPFGRTFHRSIMLH